MHIQSKLVWHTPVTGIDAGLRWLLCPGQEKKGWVGMMGWGTHLHWRIQDNTRSPTGVGRQTEGVMKFGMSNGIKPKGNDDVPEHRIIYNK